MNSNLDLDFEMLRTQRAVRKHLAEQSHLYFFHLYMGHFVTHPTADFQKEIFAITEDETIRHAIIVAFRYSAKSTIMAQSFPVWAILGKQQKKFAVIISQTQQQAKTHLANIRREFESNELLRKDYGPLEEDTDEWASMGLFLPKFNARIVAASAEQGIRGIRHGAHRPDLIVADDVEDLNSVKTMEGRNKTYEWFTGDILNLGSENTKFITVGNLLHEDSLLMHLWEDIQKGERLAVFKRYPLIDESGQCLWPGKFPDDKSLIELEKTVGNRRAWLREYQLVIVPSDEQVIRPSWLKYYDELPKGDHSIYMGVDLALSKRQAADNTALVAIHVFGSEESLKIYVDLVIINQHLTHLETLDMIEQRVDDLGGKYKVQVIVEEVAYQGAVIEDLATKNYRVEGFKVAGSDKRARLISVSHLIEMGKVYLPRSSAKPLAAQLTGFGVEKHDDMADALVMVLAKAIEDDGKSDNSTTIIFPGNSLFGDMDFGDDHRITMDTKF